MEYEILKEMMQKDFQAFYRNLVNQVKLEINNEFGDLLIPINAVNPRSFSTFMNTALAELDADIIFNDDKAVKTRNNISGYVTLEGFGSGAYAEHARIAPNNFEIKNGKLTGAVTGNDCDLLDIGNVRFNTERGFFTQWDNATDFLFIRAYNTFDSARIEAIRIQNNGVTGGSAKIGFWGATPVEQLAKANYNNWAALSDLLDALEDIGLIDSA